MNNPEFSRRAGIKVIKWFDGSSSYELVSNAYNLDCAYLNETDAPADVIAEANRLMGGKVQTVQEFRAKLASYG